MNDSPSSVMAGSLRYMASSRQMIIWVLVAAIVLFFVLSPGLILTLPAKSRAAGGSGRLFGSGETSFGSILMHTIVFTGILLLILLWLGFFKK